MATSIQIPAATPRSANAINLRPLALWHLLSLDAPTVAMLWTWFLARTSLVRLSLTSIIAMGLAVWILYAADRLLDSRNPALQTSASRRHEELEPRHYFHHHHRRPFRLAIAAASLSLAILVPRLNPSALRLDLAELALLLIYFALIHLRSATRQRLPKEILVGLFFSSATFIPTLAHQPHLRLTLLPAALLLALLLTINGLFIHAWEHPLTRHAHRHLPRLTSTAIALTLVLAATHLLSHALAAACTLALILLLTLNALRHRLSPTTLRAAADLCLLTPIFLLFR